MALKSTKPHLHWQNLVCAVITTCLSALVSDARAVTSQNLIVNGDAEVAACTADWKAVTTIPGWTVTKGSPSIVCYSIASFATPNNASGGKSFFADGPYGDSAITQTIDLSAAATAIDSGAVPFNLSGWLGGWGVYSGQAVVTLVYLGSNGQTLGSAQLSGDTPTARGLANKFLATSATGTVPAGTRSAQVTVSFISTSGSYNVGYADQLSLTLGTSVTPTPLRAPGSAVPGYDHVFFIMMENTDYSQVIGNTSSAPFINGLAAQGTLLANATGTYHPSDENYLSVAGGDVFVQGAIYFPNIKVNAPHLGDRIEAVGKTWKAYEQGMGTPCNLTNNNDKYYEPDDAPFINFTSISGNTARCQAHLFDTTQLNLDLASTTTTPNFAWIAADDYYDGEASGNGSAFSVQTQDNWLRQTLQPVFNSPAWTQQRSLLILTWDESSSSGTNHVATILVDSKGKVRKTVSNSSYNHYSIGRTIEDALGLQAMTANDRYAQPINDAFIASGGASVNLNSTTLRLGDNLIVNYSMPSNVVSSTNWIGIYKVGDTPGSVNSTMWGYTPDQQGQIAFATGALNAGQYYVALFANNGYSMLAAPVNLTINP